MERTALMTPITAWLLFCLLAIGFGWLFDRIGGAK